MTRPVYKIEVWEPGAGSALYTFTDTVVNLTTKEVVTEGVGRFSFTLPATRGLTYEYYDIDLHDKVKIWLGYDTVPADPIFVGTIGDISGTTTSAGSFRVISGLSQGEVLLTRLKKNKMWTTTDGTTIVSTFATDLGLGTSYSGDASDTTHVTMEVATRNYFDLMQEISDYYDAVNPIKKDFYVDIGDAGHTLGHLIWKTRPMRSGAAVSTLTVGDNIRDFTVTRQKDPVKNNILVYGRPCLMYPELQDEWTDDPLHANWTKIFGTTLEYVAADNKVGDGYIRCTGDKDLVEDHTIAEIKFTFPEPIHQGLHGQYDTLGMYARTPIIAPGNPFQIVLCTDSSNYFVTTYDKSTTTDWEYLEFPLGYTQTYGEDFPNGIWTATGSPEWINLNYVLFSQTWDNQDEASSIRLDDLWFKPRRPSGIPTDGAGIAASIATYGQRDLEVIDERMRTNAECTAFANALLWQKKDAPIQIDVISLADTNLLVGDRLTMTLAAENISAAPYDVISVEHNLTASEFTSTVTMVNSENTRTALERTPLNTLVTHARQIRRLETERMMLGY